MEQWNTRIGRLIGQLGKPDFPQELAKVLRSIAPYDNIIAYAYCRADVPLDLFNDYAPEDQEVFLTPYQAGAYILDPFFEAHRSDCPTGFYGLRELAPDRFFRSQYYKLFYARTQLIDELGYLVRLDSETTVIITMGRRLPSARFRARETQDFQRFTPIAAALMAQHWGDLPLKAPRDAVTGTSGTAPLDEIATVSNNFCAGRLTERERDVVAMILRGYSSEAIGLHLGIAHGTVKVHRRHIYRKLTISSQAELFALFVQQLPAR